MGLPRDYNKALHHPANFYAARCPITMPFRIGPTSLLNSNLDLLGKEITKEELSIEDDLGEELKDDI